MQGFHFIKMIFQKEKPMLYNKILCIQMMEFLMQDLHQQKIQQESIGEFVIEITNDSQILQLGSQEIKSKPTKVSPSILEKTNKPKPKKDTSNPIIPVLEKAKTKSIKLNIRIPMDLPSKEFISVLDESFDDDVLNILSEYIISNIDNHREFLKDHSLKAIKDWYKKN